MLDGHLNFVHVTLEIFIDHQFLSNGLFCEGQINQFHEYYSSNYQNYNTIN